MPPMPPRLFNVSWMKFSKISKSVTFMTSYKSSFFFLSENFCKREQAFVTVNSVLNFGNVTLVEMTHLLLIETISTQSLFAYYS